MDAKLIQFDETCILFCNVNFTIYAIFANILRSCGKFNSSLSSNFLGDL